MQEYKTAAARGKLILLGEHSVLQGGGAVAMPFGTGCELAVTPASKMDWQVQPVVSPQVFNQLQQAWKLTLQGTKLAEETFKVGLNFKLPPGAGFGMSASWSVALVRWAKDCLGWDEDACLKKLQALEDFHHGGVASGIDHLTIWHNVPQALVDGHIQPVDLNPDITKALRVFYTGTPAESTAQMIERVQNSGVKLDLLSKNLVQNLDSITMLDLSDIINKAGVWLEASGAVTPKLVEKFKAFRAAGGAVKICGAGGYKSGSGAAIAWHEDEVVLGAFLAEFEVLD